MYRYHPSEITPETLKIELSRFGRSQAGLARRLGKDTSAVNRMVSGERHIKAAELPIILDYLESTTSDRDAEVMELEIERNRVSTGKDPTDADLERLSRNASSGIAETAAKVMTTALRFKLGGADKEGSALLDEMCGAFPEVAVYAAHGADIIDARSRDAIITLLDESNGRLLKKRPPLSEQESLDLGMVVAEAIIQAFKKIGLLDADGGAEKSTTKTA